MSAVSGSRPERWWISQGSSFETEIGYARAVVDGDWVFVSGTTGFDYTSMTIEDGVVAQCRRALDNIDAALREAGASPADVVRVQYLLVDRDDFGPIIPLLGEFFADARPAATMLVVVGLADERMRIEIEVTARRRGPTSGAGPDDSEGPAALDVQVSPTENPNAADG